MLLQTRLSHRAGRRRRPARIVYACPACVLRLGTVSRASTLTPSLRSRRLRPISSHEGPAPSAYPFQTPPASPFSPSPLFRSTLCLHSLPGLLLAVSPVIPTVLFLLILAFLVMPVRPFRRSEAASVALCNPRGLYIARSPVATSPLMYCAFLARSESLRGRERVSDVLAVPLLLLLPRPVSCPRFRPPRVV